MRISRHQMFMEFAVAASKRSTCGRMAVGAVVVVNNNVISIGYNGPPPGEPHCSPLLCNQLSGCKRSIHAEQNAIERMSMSHLRGEGKDLYTTISPCQSCAEMIIDLGFRTVYYLNEYRIATPLSHLAVHGVTPVRMTASGYLIQLNGEISEET